MKNQKGDVNNELECKADRFDLRGKSEFFTCDKIEYSTKNRGLFKEKTLCEMENRIGGGTSVRYGIRKDNSF